MFKNSYGECVMKKIIGVILLIATVLTVFSACTGSTHDGEFTQIPVNDDQLEKIASFGITYNTDRIVAYAHGNNFVKYVVADYIGEKKSAECSYYFYNNLEAYTNAKKELDGTSAEFDDSMWLVALDEKIASYSVFSEDLALLRESYTIKYQYLEDSTGA